MTGFQKDFVSVANALAHGKDTLPSGLNTVGEGISFLKEVIKILKVSYSC